VGVPSLLSPQHRATWRGEGREGAPSPTIQRLSFLLCEMGVVSSPMQNADTDCLFFSLAALEGGHQSHPSAQAGRQGPGSCRHQPCLREPTPSASPTFPERGRSGQQGRWCGGGDSHRKQHCSWNCDSKKHRMPTVPQPLWPGGGSLQPGALLGGGGGAGRPEARLHPSLADQPSPPHPTPALQGLLASPPQAGTTRMPRYPFWAL
jgi:hypothetical protein